MNMRYFFFLIIFMLVVGCSKENSREWIVADITVLSEADEAPLRREIYFYYNKTNQLTGSKVDEINLGYTDVNGKMHIEKSVPRGADYKIGVKIMGKPEQFFSLTNKKKNDLVIHLKPYYLYNRHIKNVNCFNETDSLWLDGFTYFGFIGCTDAIVESFLVPPPQHYGPQKSIQVKVKRNGIVTEFQKNFTLSPEVMNTLLIEY